MSRPPRTAPTRPIDQSPRRRPLDHMPRCQARRTNGTPCHGPAMKGQTVCRSHGGSAPQSRTAAERRVARVEVEAVLRSLGEPVPTDPIEGLSDALGRAAAMTQAIGAEIGRRERIAVEAGQDAAAAWELRTTTSLAPAPLVEMYGPAVDRLARLSRLAIDAGLGAKPSGKWDGAEWSRQLGLLREEAAQAKARGEYHWASELDGEG